MSERVLGRSGIAVSPVSIGTGSLGKDRRPDEPPSAQAIEAGVAMLEGPFRLIDTSNSYAGGMTERVLGAALHRVGGLPAGKVLGTKADRDLVTGAFDGDRVRRSLEESLGRLGVDRLTLYQLHDPYTVTFEEAMAPGGAVPAMIRLREEGLVDSLGIAAGPLSLVSRYAETGVFDVVLTHNRCTLLNRSASTCIQEWSERGLGVLNSAPFGGGLLARGSAAASTYAYQPAGPDVLDFVERIEEVCREWEVPLPAAALQYSARQPGVTSVLVGTARADRVAELQHLADVGIQDDFWAAIDSLGTPPVDFGDD